jgi:XTP/dITP diphosphohydrolase
MARVTPRGAWRAWSWVLPTRSKKTPDQPGGRRSTASRRLSCDIASSSRLDRLLIATTSAGKLAEWQNLLADLPLKLLTLRDVGIDFDVEETGSTFAANARLKAEAYGRASGRLTLAEDSGLTVAALDGGPGVVSARWEGSDYTHKNQLLVQLLEGRQGRERACAYVCIVVLRHPDGRSWQVRGEVRGQIAHAPAGSGGFGYDPVFYVPRLRQTLAEIAVHEKDRISHRGRAARRVRAVLCKLLEAA